jgi:uncharacterized protein (TIGR03382 family)
MIRTTAIAVLGVAAAANAQTIGVTIEIDEPVLAPGVFTIVRLVASFPDTDYALAGLTMALRFDGLAADPRDHWSGFTELPPFSGGTTGPRLGDGAIEGILVGQLNFPPAGIYADPTNPIAFFEGTFTAPADAGGGYRVDLLTDVMRFDVYPDRESGASVSYLGELTEDAATISVIPAPASAGVLALGLAATRRRR